MKVLILDWDSYGNIEPVYKRRGTEVIKMPVDIKADAQQAAALDAKLRTMLAETKPNYVFSFNYMPWASNVCQDNETPYVSWVYDSPYLNIYNYTIPNPVNHVFMFDYGVYQEFEQAGITTVHYLPMAVDANLLTAKCGAIGTNVPGSRKYQPSYLNLNTGRFSLDADVSFVGSLYTEPRHRLYDRFDSVSPYAKGYLDAIVSAQKNVYGDNFLERLLTPEIEAEMQKAYPCDPDSLDVMSPTQIYSLFVLSRQVTSLERTEILTMLGEKFKDKKLRLYTVDNSVRITGWKNIGPVEYFNEMPQVFRCSKINLNITLRSILTGIPLRGFDIMGAGGFLMTNYQAEFPEYFTPDEDFVFYENYEDLCDKVEYYLSHERERAQIAENGCRKVREEHTFDKRIDSIEETII